ncbi:two-component sensor histidine kinase [Hoyosella rhizosphaerae]|nr:two-component sensor histidine kinase [Hoyosella rhizosphaerae]
MDPDAWAGLITLAIGIAVSGPVLMGLVDPVIPRVWWMLAFALMIGAAFVAMYEHSHMLTYTALAAMVGSSWVLIAGAPALGFLPILLILVAAVSVYLAPFRVALIIVGLNTAFLGIVSSQRAVATSETVIVTVLYFAIQLATVLSSLALLREQRLRRELTEAHVELRAASALLSESARTAERLRISRNLHDSMGHQLTVLNLELEAARHREGERAREHIDRAHAVARDLLSDVRATVGELRTESTDLDIALRGIVEDLPGLNVIVDVAPNLEVGEHESAALLHAVREIVTNTLRHAHANELWIDLYRDKDGSTVLAAKDDGRGSAQTEPGNGLRGMIERFEAFGGTVLMNGKHGFAITARIPTS